MKNVQEIQENGFAIGVDIGGTNTSVGVVSGAGALLHTMSFPTQKEHTPEKFIFTLAQTIKELSHKESGALHLRGIAIAAPAAVRHEGTIQSPANLHWGTIHIVSMLEQYYDIPIVVTNDSNAAALGEMKFGSARGMKNFIVVTMGTGLGSGIVVDGHLVYGENGLAGELGHTTIEPAGRMCGCKRRGCVETYVSATGIRRTVFELLAQSTEESTLRDISFNELTADKIYELALKGDLIAKSAFDITGIFLGRTLANTAAVFDPQAIILCGGLMNAGELLLVPTIKSFNENVLHFHKGKVAILRSQLKDGEAAILGASSLFAEGSLLFQDGSTRTPEAHSQKVMLEGHA